MVLELSYAEMSFLRELVGAKQQEIWQKRYLPALKKAEDKTIEEIMVLFNDTMGKIEDIPLTDQACCAKLLHKFIKLEQEIKAALSSPTGRK